MKRLAALLVVVLLLAGLGFALLPALLSSDIAKKRIAEQITQWTGRPVTFSGEPEITLYPRPTIRLTDVAIGDRNDPGKAFMVMDQLTGTVGLLPLLLGRVEFSEFDLARPQIALRVDRSGRRNWTDLGGLIGIRVAETADEAADPQARRASAADAIKLGRFVIHDGTVTFDDARRNGHETLSAVDLDISWPSTSAAATARGSFVWRGEKVEAKGSIADPLELIAGGESSARFAVASTPLRASFSGTAATGPALQLRGEVSVTTPSVRRAADWMGKPLGEASTLGVGSVSGNGNFNAGILTITDASVELDGNRGEGVLALDLAEGTPAVQGTLAFDTFDLSPYVEAFAASLRTAGGMAAPIDIPLVDGVNYDLRLSAGRMLVGAARLDRIAASAVVTDGRLALNLGEAQFHNGRIQAMIEGDLHHEPPSFVARASVAGVAVEPALRQLFGISSVTGTGSASLEVAGEGGSWGTLLEDTAGTATVDITAGSIDGIDLKRTVEAFDASDRDGPPTRGATAFQQLHAELGLGGGQIRTRTVTADGPNFGMSFRGWASLFQPTVSGRGALILKAAAGGQALVTIPFVLGGTWLEPTLGASFDQLFRQHVRSGISPTREPPTDRAIPAGAELD